MDYSYVDELMSGYVWYKKLKDVSLSDAIRQEFEKYYKKITGYKGSFNDSIEQELTNLAENIKQQVRNELLSAGIKKRIYVKEYVEFLFKACLLMMDKFGVEQNKATAILGMPRSAYYKLDIYPLRCYDAYMGMVDEDNRYALKPNDKDSDGIQIIRCINREIQSKYACSRFVGVCNDLDIFANVPLQSGKKFIMTYNNNFLDVARYYFASGNFLSDDEKTLSGQIKDKIVSIMKLNNQSVKSGSVESILFNAYLWDVLKDGCEEYGDEINNSKKYYIYLNDILEEIRDDGRDVDEVIMNNGMADDNEALKYYKTFDDYTISTKFKWNEKNRKKVISVLEELLANIKDGLIRKVYKDVKKKDVLESFKSYRDWLVRAIDNDCGVLDLHNEPEDDKVFLAAVYWIREVFGLDKISSEKYDTILKYLSTAKISDYVDRISRSPKNERYLLLKSVDFKLFGKQKMGEDDEVEGFDEINLEELCSLPDKQLRPILLYIDAEAYPNVFDVIQDIKCLSNIIFVLHTKEVMSDMNVLSCELNLYYYIGEMKK